MGRPIGFTAIQLAVVAALGVVASAALETTTATGLAAAAPGILYVGLLSSALAFTILTVSLRSTPPSEAAVIVSLETVFAALAAYLVLGERLSAMGWLGAALILSAILMLQVGAAFGPRRGRAARAMSPPDR
jgi:drug/metabolite transporter (DMT)-like permease